MVQNEITFENLPKAVAHLVSEKTVAEINEEAKTFISEKHSDFSLL